MPTRTHTKLKAVFVAIMSLFFVLSYSHEDGCHTHQMVWETESSDFKEKFEHAYKLLIVNPKEAYEMLSLMMQDLSKEQSQTLMIAYWLRGAASFNLNNIPAGYADARRAFEMLTPESKYTFLGGNVVNQYGLFAAVCGDDDHGLKFLKEAVDVFNVICTEGSVMQFTNYNEIAKIYIKQKKYDLAKEAYDEAYAEASLLEDRIWLSSVINNIGLLQHELKNYDEAMRSFKKAKSVLEVKGPEHLLFLVNIEENIAAINIDIGDPEMAYGLLANVAEVRESNGQPTGAIQAKIKMVLAADKMNDKGKMLPLMKEIDLMYAKHKERLERYISEGLDSYFKFKLSYYLTTNDPANYTKQADTYITFINDKNKRQKDLVQVAYDSYVQLVKSKYERQLELEKQLLVTEEESHAKGNKLLISLAAILGLGVVMLLLLVNIRRAQRKEVEQENKITKLVLENTRLEKERVDEMLESKQRDLINVIAFGSMRTKFQEGLLKKIQKAFEENEDPKTTIRSLSLDIKAQINVEERLSKLKSDLANLNALFEKQLLSKFPHLSRTEREICAFIRLNLSIKEIAQVRGASTDSVKMARLRIRKKLGLDSKEGLDQFVQAI